MKKYLVLAGMLATLAQPVLAQGMTYSVNPCNPCAPTIREIRGQVCPPCPVANPCPCPSGAAAPVVTPCEPACPAPCPAPCPVVNPCPTPCQTGAAAPVTPPCCPEKKTWRQRFFSF